MFFKEQDSRWRSLWLTSCDFLLASLLVAFVVFLLTFMFAALSMVVWATLTVGAWTFPAAFTYPTFRQVLAETGGSIGLGLILLLLWKILWRDEDDRSCLR